jgi:hypothetical protein
MSLSGKPKSTPHTSKWGIARQTIQPHGLYDGGRKTTYWGCGSRVCPGSISTDPVSPNASRIPHASGQARDLRLLLPKGRVRYVANLALNYVQARPHCLLAAATVLLGAAGVNGVLPGSAGCGRA